VNLAANLVSATPGQTITFTLEAGNPASSDGCDIYDRVMTLTLPDNSTYVFGPNDYPNPTALTFVGSVDYIANKADLTLDEGTWNAQVSWTGVLRNGADSASTGTKNSVVTYTPAYLTLIKTVINDNGGDAIVADFPLFVDTTSVISGVQNTFDAGTYTASETEMTGYTAGVWGGDCAANGTITLLAGETKTCTITNDDQQAYIIINKTVVNDNGGLAVADDFLLTVDNNAVLDEVAYAVSPGIHTANETLLAGYTAGVWGGDCDVNGDVTVALGETKTCTITNDDIFLGCTLTQGYWSTHSNSGPAPYDDNWANLGILEELTIFYMSDQTWYQVFNTPIKGNSYYQLAHQYMAAELNILNGASTTPAIDTAITSAENLFNTYTPTQIGKMKGNNPIRAEFISLAETLGSYNEGTIGPGHCN
jgi:hypothetical protein